MNQILPVRIFRPHFSKFLLLFFFIFAMSFSAIGQLSLSGTTTDVQYDMSKDELLQFVQSEIDQVQKSDLVNYTSEERSQVLNTRRYYIGLKRFLLAEEGNWTKAISINHQMQMKRTGGSDEVEQLFDTIYDSIHKKLKG
jgi:hypothetical protein